MKKIILYIVLLLPLTGFSQKNMLDIDYSLPGKYILTEIKVTGNENISKGLIIAYSGLNIGSEISIPGDEISKAIMNLWKQKLFSDIRIECEKIESNNISINIIVKTLPLLSRYLLKGVTKSESDKIKEKITLTQGEIVTDQLLKTTDEEIRKYFRDKGFYSPIIKINEIPDSLFGKNSLKVIIEI